ncbi:MAG: hypothetical protein F4X34_03340 [Chloroflexi bacterium]|nr:hypothetical protein [Chloroflexota bacterium]
MAGRRSRGVVQEAVALFPEGWRTAYLVILGLLLAAGFGLAILEEFLWNGKIGIVVNVLAVSSHGGGIAPVSVLLAVFLTEGWRTMALLSEKLRDRIRDQGHAAGLAEGIEKASSDWRKWFDDYEEAHRKGEPFDEPPPDRR